MNFKTLKKETPEEFAERLDKEAEFEKTQIRKITRLDGIRFHDDIKMYLSTERSVIIVEKENGEKEYLDLACNQNVTIVFNNYERIVKTDNYKETVIFESEI